MRVKQTASRVKKIIQSLHHPFSQPDKILLRLWNKNIQKYTDICFQSASRMQSLDIQEMMQWKCFFRHQTEKSWLENL